MLASLVLFALIGCKQGPEVPVVNDPRRVPDVNGDGLADVVFPVREVTTGSPEAAVLAIWYGSADGFGGTASRVEIEDGDPLLPSYADFVGDVDGDGASDLVLGETGVGALTVPKLVLGGPDGPRASEAIALADPGGETYGARGVYLGDVDGDGLDDVGVERTSTFSVHLAAGGFDGPAEVVWDRASMPDWFTMPDGTWRGEAVEGVQAIGDVTGDGLADVRIRWRGLRDDDTTFVQTWAWVAPGPLDFDTPWIPAHTVFPALGTNHNITLDSQGDVDGDGMIDLLAFVNFYETLRSGDGWAATEVVGSVDFLGGRVASDVNADGYDDVVLGRGDVVLGSETGVVGAIDVSYPVPDGARPEDLDAWRHGLWGAGVGDVDGDGYDDMVIASDVDAWLWRGGRNGMQKDDVGTHLFVNYVEPYGLAARSVGP